MWRRKLLWNPLDYAIDWVSREMRRNAWRLITTDMVETKLAWLSEYYPDLALAAMRKVTSDRLTRVLRNLLREQISLRDFPVIIERVVTFDRVVADEWEFVVLDDRLPVHPRLAAITASVMFEAELVRYIRLGLKRTIAEAASRGSETIPAFRLGTAAIKERLLGHLAASFGDPNAAALDAAAVDRIRSTISATVSRYVGPPVSILTEGTIRPLVRDIVADEFPDLPVLGYGELDTSIKVRTLGRISLD